MSENRFVRSVYDLSPVAWFEESLMGAVGLNDATAEAKDPKKRITL